MAFDKSLPGNSEKIRNLGVVIRPNWEAIEEGDDVGVGGMLQQRSVQLDNRTGLAANNDPITNAGTHYLYSKDDGGGTQEAYTKDSAGNVIQLTEAGSLGSGTTDLVVNDFKFEDNPTTYNQGNIVKARGSFSNAGVLVSGSNLSTSGTPHPATGTYNVDVDADVLEAGTSYQVMAIPTSSSGRGRSVYMVSKGAVVAATAVTVQLKITSYDDGLGRDETFDILVVGGV